MAEFYRFRNMERLLGKDQELEKQTIYFASPEQLNDPMEGFRDIVWSGDKIVWTNLFKNYVYCLHQSYYLFKTEGDSIQLGSLPVLGNWDDELRTHRKDLFDDIWDRFLKLPNMQQIIDALADTKRGIRYEELAYWLSTIHGILLLVEIPKSYLEHRLIHKSEMPRLPRPLEGVSVSELLKPVLTVIEQTGKAESDKHNTILLEYQRLDNISRIINLYRGRDIFTGGSRKNKLVMFDFPKVYLKELERLLWPKWYTACFTKSYHNSSVWGHYGDSHKGACLIFESEEEEESNILELDQMTTGERVRIPFFAINYVKKVDPVDFFQSIGMVLRLSALMKLWYTDQDGNISECADAWLENYSDIFYRDITAKTEDWEYEQEYRLILDNGDELDEEKNPTLTYNFNSLKGIIFGINTSDEDKLKIMEIIEDKCRENNRDDFKLFQAYYSPEAGKIHKHKIPLPFFNNNDES